MSKVVLPRGGAAGAAIGVVASQLIGLAVIRPDDVPDLVDREDLPVLYVIAAIIGAVVGLVVGIAGLAVGRRVADLASGSAPRRRLLGALAAGGTAGVLSSLTAAPLLSGVPLAVVALVVVGGLTAWLLLPGVVDLETPSARELPAWGARAQATPAMTSGRRIAVTVVAAVVGAVIGTQVLMGLVSQASSLSRTAYDVIAIGVMGVLLVAIGAAVWRATAGPRGPYGD